MSEEKKQITELKKALKSFDRLTNFFRNKDFGVRIFEYQYYFEDLLGQKAYSSLYSPEQLSDVYISILTKILLHYKNNSKNSDIELRQKYAQFVIHLQVNLVDKVEWKKEYEEQIFTILSRGTWSKGTALDQRAISKDMAAAEVKDRKAAEIERIEKKSSDDLFDCLSKDIVDVPTYGIAGEIFDRFQLFEVKCDEIINRLFVHEKLDELESRLSKIENPGYSCTDALMDTLMLVIAAVPVGFVGGAVGGILKKKISASTLGNGLTGALIEVGKKSLSIAPKLYKSFKNEDKRTKGSGSVTTEFLSIISFTAQYHKCQIIHKQYSEQQLRDLSKQIYNFTQRLIKYGKEFMDILSYDIHTATLAGILKPNKTLYFKPHNSTFISFKNLEKTLEDFRQVDVISRKSEAEKNLMRIYRKIINFLYSSRLTAGGRNEFSHFANELISSSNFNTTNELLQGGSEFIRTIYNTNLDYKCTFRININIVKAKADNLFCWVIQSVYKGNSESANEHKFWYIAHIGVLNEAFALSWFDDQFQGKYPMEIDFSNTLEKGNLIEYNKGSSNQKKKRADWKIFTSIYEKLKVVG